MFSFERRLTGVCIVGYTLWFFLVLIMFVVKLRILLLNCYRPTGTLWIPVHYLQVANTKIYSVPMQ